MEKVDNISFGSLFCLVLSGTIFMTDLSSINALSPAQISKNVNLFHANVPKNVLKYLLKTSENVWLFLDVFCGEFLIPVICHNVIQGS